ncbi:MAG: polysaccharide biosynthesis protein [Burkholderiales bacterium]
MNWRRLLAIVHDIVTAVVAWVLAFWLRFNLDIPPEFERAMLASLPFATALYAGAFLGFGLYRGLWRFASLPDLRRIVLAVGTGALAVPALFALVQAGFVVPRSVYLLTPVLLAAMMTGSRIAYRAWKEGHFGAIVAKPGATPVLVIGAGRAAALLLKELASNPAWRVVGLVDDDPRKRGAELFGEKVFGPVAGVGQIAQDLGVSHAIIAMPGAPHAVRRRALDLCAARGMNVMTVPAISDIVSGKVSVSTLRRIELDDLLGRDPVQLDDAGLHAFLDGRSVLVTGAGGSIGSELCRQIARFAPARLVLLENSEFALYSIEQEFRDRAESAEIAAVIGDAKDARRVRQVFERYRPDVVFHAAAYKHVPLMEDDNALEAVINNVLSTLVVAQAAMRAGARKFVLVSTDKAVNPANVMGASKRLAEIACQELQAKSQGPEATQFVIVRFGNVLGSTGSVIPRFRQQIARGGPVTVTDPEMQRYFMSIPEATQLVMQAAMMGRGGEIFVLDMGEPVKIDDLARQLIRLSGFAENDIRIEYSGLRPGEKLYEEPLADSETTLPTPHPKLRIARARAPDEDDIVGKLIAWLQDPGDTHGDAVRERLRRWVPEYTGRPQASRTPATPQKTSAF